MTRYVPQWLQQGVYAAGVDRRLIGALWPSPASAGCAVTASSGMALNVAAGQVAVPTGNATGSALCSSDAVEVVTLAAAPTSPNNRIDLVVCQARGNDLDGGSNNDFIFTSVTGTAATTPAAPAVPANAVALAQISVAGNTAAIVAGNITDLRGAGLAVPASRFSSWTRAVGVPATNAEFGVFWVPVGNAPGAGLADSWLSVSGDGITVTFQRRVIAAVTCNASGFTQNPSWLYAQPQSDPYKQFFWDTLNSYGGVLTVGFGFTWLYQAGDTLAVKTHGGSTGTVNIATGLAMTQV
jgi:hypothetical protein